MKTLIDVRLLPEEETVRQRQPQSRQKMLGMLYSRAKERLFKNPILLLKKKISSQQTLAIKLIAIIKLRKKRRAENIPILRYGRQRRAVEILAEVVPLTVRRQMPNH